ncbi:MAG: hypothetical protein ACYS76_10215 [Planctomycetota bacterium]|jgi:preprotein translocase subunit SecF
MEVAILIVVLVGILLAIFSGVWVAAALVRAVSNRQAGSGGCEEDVRNGN